MFFQQKSRNKYKYYLLKVNTIFGKNPNTAEKKSSLSIVSSLPSEVGGLLCHSLGVIVSIHTGPNIFSMKIR